eukprot:4635-Heterococcus_DN1.PRE.2
MAEQMEVDNPLQQPLGEDEGHAEALELDAKRAALELFIDQSRTAPRSRCNNYTIGFMKTWYTSNLTGTQLKVPEEIYQRNPREGWPDAQQRDYILAVLRGEAAHPFTIRTITGTTRVIDGGHRLLALMAFMDDSLVVNVGGHDVYYRDLTVDQKAYFDSLSMPFIVYDNITAKAEIDIYIQLNSGLPFSVGEKLAAMRRVNGVATLGEKLQKSVGTGNPVMITLHTFQIFNSIFTSAKEPGRGGDLKSGVIAAYNLLLVPAYKAQQIGNEHDRATLGSLNYAHTFQDGFVKIISKLATVCAFTYNAATTWDTPARLETLVIRFVKTMEIYTASDATGRLSPTRAMLLCMILVAEKGVDGVNPAAMTHYFNDYCPQEIKGKDAFSAAIVQSLLQSYDEAAADAEV